MVWHNNVVAYRDGGPNSVNRPQGGNDNLAKRQKRRPPGSPRCARLPARLKLGDARQHLPPLGDRQRASQRKTAGPSWRIQVSSATNYTKIASPVDNQVPIEIAAPSSRLPSHHRGAGPPAASRHQGAGPPPASHFRGAGRSPVRSYFTKLPPLPSATSPPSQPPTT